MEDATCPRCKDGEETPDHIVFWCRKVKRLEDKNGRREWVRENGLRWDGWDALASKLWLRREDCIVFAARTERKSYDGEEGGSWPS